jgi:hypothetical protein
MFAVTGTWQVDGVLEAEQLAHIAEIVRQQPGFVRGFWGQAPDDSTLAHSFVLFEDEAAAEGMAKSVRDAIPSASVRVVQILADASVA